jgi:diguanylate cyclase (GGDEF)-like protein
MTTNEFGTLTKIRTAGILVSVLIFVVILFILPYNLTQISKQNSSVLLTSLFVDESFSASIKDIVEQDDIQWKKVSSFNFGLNSAPHWLKVKLTQPKTQGSRFLLINYGLLDHVNIWFLTSPQNGSEVVGAYSTGDAFPYYDRIIKSEKFVFEVPQVDGELYAFIRATSKGPINTPIEIWSANDYIEYSSLQKLFLGLFFGYMIAMALSNLYIYAMTRNRLFLIYTGYVSSIAMVVASIHGIGFHYIWPNTTWLQEFGTPIFACLTMIFIISLTTNLLELRKHSPLIYRTLRNIKYIFIGLLCLCFVGLPYEVAIQSVLVLLIISMPILFSIGLLLAIKGILIAKYFCAAWGALLLSGIAIAMENFGLYESPVNSSYLLMIGAITEALLLALALAVNFNGQLANAKRTRDMALQNEQEAIEAKDELIQLQETTQFNLEYSVEERTLELEIALRELSEKNRELEKLSAIDPLTGLMNRGYFDKQILAECRRSKREVTTLSLAMLDIDFFKKINDTFGHLCGDHCLKVFASILKESTKRPSDIICRYGGEEFVLILPNTAQDGLEKLLERVRENVKNKKILFEGHEISMTVSIGGCSRVVLAEEEKDLMIAFADKQLYRAKDSGRNIVMVGNF